LYKNRLKQGEYTLSKQTDTLNTTGITALPALGKGRVALGKDLPSNNLTVNAGFAECQNSYTRQRIDAVEEVTVWFFYFFAEGNTRQRILLIFFIHRKEFCFF
jgi:hypothetical protein